MAVLELKNVKKVSKAALTFVFLKKIGEPEMFSVSLDELQRFIEK